MVCRRSFKLTMSVAYPYRAIICGTEHIVRSCDGRSIVTDKGKFQFVQLAGGYPIHAARLLDLATLVLDEKGEWLINGYKLNLLSYTRNAPHLFSILEAEALRVYKGEICGIAWVQTKERPYEGITNILDRVLKFWATPIPLQPKKQPEGFSDVMGELSENLMGMSHLRGWYSNLANSISTSRRAYPADIGAKSDCPNIR